MGDVQQNTRSIFQLQISGSVEGSGFYNYDMDTDPDIDRNTKATRILHAILTMCKRCLVQFYIVI